MALNYLDSPQVAFAPAYLLASALGTGASVANLGRDVEPTANQEGASDSASSANSGIDGLGNSDSASSQGGWNSPSENGNTNDIDTNSAATTTATAGNSALIPTESTTASYSTPTDSDSSTTSDTASEPSSGGGGTSTRTKIAIAVPVAVVGAAILLLVAFFLFRWRRKRQRQAMQSASKLESSSVPETVFVSQNNIPLETPLVQNAQNSDNAASRQQPPEYDQSSAQAGLAALHPQEHENHSPAAERNYSPEEFRLDRPTSPFADPHDDAISQISGVSRHGHARQSRNLRDDVSSLSSFDGDERHR